MGYNPLRQLTPLVRTKISPYGAQGHYMYKKRFEKLADRLPIKGIVTKRMADIFFSGVYILIR